MALRVAGPGASAIWPHLPSQHHFHSASLTPHTLATDFLLTLTLQTYSCPGDLTLVLLYAWKVLPDLPGCFSSFKSQLKVTSPEKPSLTILPTTDISVSVSCP